MSKIFVMNKHHNACYNEIGLGAPNTHNILHSMVDTIEKANVITSREGKLFDLSSHSFIHLNYNH